MATVMRVPDLVCFEIHFHLQLYSQGTFFVPHPGSKQGAATQGKGRVEGRGLSDTQQYLPGQLEKLHKQTVKLCFSFAWGLLVCCHGIVSLLESVYLLWRGHGNTKGTHSSNLEPSPTRASSTEQPLLGHLVDQQCSLGALAPT